MEPLIHLNYPIDKKILLEESKIAKIFSNPYGNDPRWPGQVLECWHISHYNSNYIRRVMQDLEVDGKPRFYWLDPNQDIPEHVDNNTTCSINFILSEDPAPVTIGGKEYFYESILLNTSIPHSVHNGPVERVLFKISIFDESFEDLAKRIKYKK